MGLLDRASDALDRAAERSKEDVEAAREKTAAAKQEHAEIKAAAQADRATRERYDAEVNKGSIRMGNLKRVLNQRWSEGWRLHTTFEQDGNTVMVFERRDDFDYGAR